MQLKRGVAVARGLAIGPAFFFSGGERSIPEYRIAPERVSMELTRLQRAQQAVRRDIENLISALKGRTRQEEISIFEGHLMILEDPVLHEDTVKCIREGGVNAEAAIRKTILAFRERFERMNDPYFRERVQDLNDVERRLQEALAGFGDLKLSLPERPFVLVAGELSSSELVRLPRDLVLALVTGGGSATSHVALLARAMGIPAVAGLGDLAESVAPGEILLVDGTRGVVTLHPEPETVREFECRQREERRLSAEVAATGAAGTLKGGGEVRVYANVHPGMALADLKASGARGVGLYRSEYLWLNRQREIGEDEQFEAYREVAAATAALGESASVAIRVLDIGGDKLVKGLSVPEANPFLGNRSIRYLLSHRELFRTQLRAILRASAFGPVRLLYPMIAGMEELQVANRLLAEVRAQLDRDGIAYDRALKVGIMIEVPAAALNAAAFARQVDFFSIGTNDLIQYTLAADRGNEEVAYLYQPLHPSVVKLVDGTLAAATQAHIPVSVCGASAGDPVAGALWAGMGAKSLSMSVACIPVVSKLLSLLTAADLREYAEAVRNLDDALTGAEAYAFAREWLERRVPDLGGLAL